MEFCLGKRDYVHDKRTLMMGAFFTAEAILAPPTNFDFDLHRSQFPRNLWGNDEYGDCVYAGRANHLLRLERKETRRTVHLTDEFVIERYKERTGTIDPGDANDNGLVVLSEIRDWRNIGWNFSNHTYKIDAYGELDVNQRNELDSATYYLGGIQLGLLLPLSAREQLHRGEPWDVVEGPDARAGSWGGHLVYSKRYDPRGRYALTWGREVYMTDLFIKTYCDEVWCVVDSLNTWGKRHEINVTELESELRSIGAREG